MFWSVPRTVTLALPTPRLQRERYRLQGARRLGERCCACSGGSSGHRHADDFSLVGCSSVVPTGAAAHVWLADLETPTRCPPGRF